MNDKRWEWQANEDFSSYHLADDEVKGGKYELSLLDSHQQLYYSSDDSEFQCIELQDDELDGDIEFFKGKGRIEQAPGLPPEFQQALGEIFRILAERH